MNASAMAQFFEDLGHRVIQTESCYWYDVHSHFYLSFPHHRLIDPRPNELSSLFTGLSAGVRYFSPLRNRGRASYALICEDRDYDVDKLSANTRSKVRRGLKACTIERLQPSYVKEHGKVIHADTIRRIRIQDPYPWERYWQAVEAAKCVEVWGAWIDNTLVAYLVGVIADKCCEILVARSLSDALRSYPNNALLFTVVRDLLSRSEIEQVFFGVESLEDVSSIDQFKESMGFVKSPICQQVVLRPLLQSVMCNPLTVQAIRRLADWRPQSEFCRKLNGLTTLTLPAHE